MIIFLDTSGSLALCSITQTWEGLFLYCTEFLWWGSMWPSYFCIHNAEHRSLCWQNRNRSPLFLSLYSESYMVNRSLLEHSNVILPPYIHYMLFFPYKYSSNIPYIFRQLNRYSYIIIKGKYKFLWRFSCFALIDGEKRTLPG